MGKASRPHEHHDGTPALVKAFVSGATSAFASLLPPPASRWSVTSKHITSRGVVEVAPEDIEGFFVVTGSFANSLVAGEITFGDREYLVNTVLGNATRTDRYGLWEWEDALDQPEIVPRDTAYVMTVNRLESIVQGMAQAVGRMQHAIASASPEVIQRIEGARELVRLEDHRRMMADDHRRASAAAAKAFHARDYRRVVGLLEPLDAVLTPAERGQLAYARRHL